MRPFRRQPRQGTPPAPGGRLERLRRGWGAFQRATDRFRLLRDVVGALILVGIVLGVATVATGGKWPPVVVIESGSMMHPVTETSYGRLGTIDVGDIVFIRDVDERDQIRTWAEGGRDHYGRPGNIIAYAANGNRANESTPIIVHRAVAWIDVETHPVSGDVRYRLHWIDGQVLTFGAAGVYFPALGFHEGFGFSPTNGYRPPHSGFLTKGDNAFTNPATDQALGLSHPVDPSWIEGTIHGEVPWMGLGKLALQRGRTNPEVFGWERIGNAFAPIELWSMFFLVAALVVLVPFTIDTVRVWRKDRERRAHERRLRREAEEAMRARKAARRAPVAFTAIAVQDPKAAPPQPPAPRAPGR